MKVPASCCAVTEATWPEENDQRAEVSSGLCSLCCGNSLLRPEEEAAVAGPPCFVVTPRSPLTLGSLPQVRVGAF